MSKKRVIFEKMHGAGNDFILIDNRNQNFIPDTVNIQNLANRHTGIGFDQLLLILDSDVADCDAAYRFFNPDGSEAEQCGNGQRCISRYLYDTNPNKNQFKVSGLAGIIGSQINDDGSVTINMGGIRSIDEQIILKQTCFHVDFGNPHLIHIVDDTDTSNLNDLKLKFTEKHTNGINFEIAEILDDESIKLRVYERGTGETQACGSGACATVAALQYAKKLTDKVKVILPGGTLVVEYNHNDDNLYLTGPTAYVFTGEFLI